MTPRSPASLLAILLPALLFSCGGKLVAEQSFDLSEGAATLDWEAPAPEGETSLWLAYTLSTGSENDFADQEREPVYHIPGTLELTHRGSPVYEGVLRLDSEQPPTSVGGTVRVGSRESCNAKGCTISGRVRALELGELGPGGLLRIHAQLPLEGQPGAIEALTMQLRSK
jgi:hypothetical protein